MDQTLPTTEACNIFVLRHSVARAKRCGSFGGLTRAGHLGVVSQYNGDQLLVLTDTRRSHNDRDEEGRPRWTRMVGTRLINESEAL